MNTDIATRLQAEDTVTGMFVATDTTDWKDGLIPARLLVIFACTASMAMWLWFTSPKLNYLLNIVVPVLVLLLAAVVAPMLALLVAGVRGLVGSTAPVITAASTPDRRKLQSIRRKHHVFAAAFTAATMVSIVFHVPVYARFALSRPAMDAFLASVRENDGSLPATMRVGSYDIDTRPTLRRDGALVFHLAGDNEAGFTYSATPIGYPGWNRGDGHRLGSGWYWFSDD